MSSIKPNANVPQMPTPRANVNSLALVVNLLKQGMDSLAGYRGGVSNRAVTFNDLVDLNLVAPAATSSAPSTPASNSSLTAETNARIAADDALQSEIDSLTPQDILVVTTEVLLSGFAGNVFVDNMTGFPLTITLPSLAVLGQTVKVVDAGGNAATNNIIISGSGSDMISGASTFVFVSNYQGADFIWAGTTWVAS